MAKKLLSIDEQIDRFKADEKLKKDLKEQRIAFFQKNPTFAKDVQVLHRIVLAYPLSAHLPERFFEERVEAHLNLLSIAIGALTYKGKELPSPVQKQNKSLMALLSSWTQLLHGYDEEKEEAEALPLALQKKSSEKYLQTYAAARGMRLNKNLLTRTMSIHHPGIGELFALYRKAKRQLDFVRSAALRNELLEAFEKNRTEFATILNFAFDETAVFTSKFAKEQQSEFFSEEMTTAAVPTT
ncbi:MAG: hypothetical protein WC759_00160 [Candidatus Micrarchaeia archaeon]|jgi:hypothetical protein